MGKVNFAENQERHDKGLLTLEACWNHGRTIRSYGWAPDNHTPGTWSAEQRAAYLAGYNGEPLDSVEQTGRTFNPEELEGLERAGIGKAAEINCDNCGKPFTTWLVNGYYRDICCPACLAKLAAREAAQK